MSKSYISSLLEAMNALTSGYMPGMKDAGSVYIVNYMQNNAFAQALTTDYKMRHMITRDYSDNILKFVDTVTDDDYGFDNSTDIKKIYRVTDKSHLSEGLEKIKANIGNKVDEGFIYECILGDKMYSWDQIEFSDKVEEIVPFSKLVSNMNESIRNYTLYSDTNKKIDKVLESYILESKVFNLPDIYYNKDKFDSGEINLCFITGFSGSGKSTLADSNKNSIHIELDDIVENYRFTDDQLKEYGDYVYKFFTSSAGKQYRLSQKSDINDIGGYVFGVTKTYCSFIMQYANSHRSNKFIVEGLQLYGALDPDTLPFKNYAVYIKGTSELVSSYRAAKRNIDKDKEEGYKTKIGDKISMFINQLKDAKENSKYFEEWYNYFKNLMK